MLGENQDLTLLPVITYIYIYIYVFVWVNLCKLFILYFKPSFLNRAETELKCNKGITETVRHWHFIIQTVGA